MLHLVLGGARSGKSSFSESWVLSHVENKQPIYIATAKSLDAEMQQRIEHHQQQRSAQHWRLIECGEHLTEALKNAHEGDVVLVDCITLWLTSHVMIAESIVKKSLNNAEELSANQYLSQQIEALIDSLNKHPATIVLVANEIGLGVIPMGEITRLFVDHAGWLNQKLASIAERVTLVTAGLPMTLKSEQV